MKHFLITPWGFKPFLMRFCLLGLALFDVAKAVITIVTLGNVTWVHRYGGLAEFIAKTIREEEESQTCDCPECQGEHLLTEKEIKAKLKEFELSNASPEEVMEWFESRGVHVTMMPLNEASPFAPKEEKKEVFH